MRAAAPDGGRRIIVPAFFCVLSIIVLRAASAAQLQEAQVTQIIKDVQLLPSTATARPATVHDNIRDGTSVRTGTDSRAELTFTDQTLTRMGENTLFSFNEGTRNLSLGSGVMLVRVPKNSGGAKIVTAGVTAGVTGTTLIFEYHKNANSKLIVLEGLVQAWLNKFPDRVITLHPGQMLVIKPGANELDTPVLVDLAKLMATSLLVIDFPPLASQALIAEEIRKQQYFNAEGTQTGDIIVYTDSGIVSLFDPPPLDTLDQRAATFLFGSTIPPIVEFGPLNTITSPNPYVITSGTKIVTAPTITTNGVKNGGKIYRDAVTDGQAAQYFFGSTSAFDGFNSFNAVGEGGNNDLPMAVFKFNSLQINGDPQIKVPANGAPNIGLIGINGLNSGAGVATLTFPGMHNVLLATLSGSINFGANISFANINSLFMYARGAGSNLTIASAMSNMASVRLDAEGSVQVNGNENVSFFQSTAGTFLTGTGQIVASDLISITAQNTLNFASARFNPGAASGQQLSLRGDTINLDVSANQAIFKSANLVNIFAGAGNLTITGDPAGDTIAFGNSSVDIESAGGNITGLNIDLVHPNFGITLVAAGDINFRSIAGAFSVGAGKSITTNVGDLTASFVNAGTNINVKQNLTTTQTTAGGNIVVGTTLTSKGVSAGGKVTADHISVLGINGTGTPNTTTVVAGAGGITPYLPSGPNALHTFNVLTVQSPNGINFNGDLYAPGADGGALILNAQSQVFGAGGINNDATFDGGNAPAAGLAAGNGGLFQVNTSGAIAIDGPKISATTGIIDPNDSPSGAGGSVSLVSTAGPVTIANSTIQVSSGDALGAPNRRSSSSGGNIAIRSDVATGVAINVASSAQLLSLLQNTAPGPNGVITFVANGANSSISINGKVQVDKGVQDSKAAIDVRHNGDAGQISLTNATMSADVIKIDVLGTNGRLNIGGGTISATNTLKLYADGSNGQLNFVASCQIGGGSVNILAAKTITINNGVTVTVTGQMADVFTDNAHYSSVFGGDNTTTGTFAGSGAKNPAAFNSPARPGIGPVGDRP